MAYICEQTCGCKNCPHYRWDDDEQEYCCWAKYDENHNIFDKEE